MSGEKKLGMDCYSFGGDTPKRSRWRAALAVAASMACGAAGYKVTFDIMQIRGATGEARRILLDEQRPEAQRRDGIVATFFDATESVESWHLLAAREDALGEQARLALEKVEQAARKRRR